MEIKTAVELIINSKRITAFTGAGISVESGIPPFRGKEGLWSKYDPIILDLDFFISHTNKSWPIIKKLFFDFFESAQPNKAHYILAKWEMEGILNNTITQNIDALHQKAGSTNVYEFHGTSESFICTKCFTKYLVSQIKLTELPPFCTDNKCKGVLKPNFIFFGEGIPIEAYEKSLFAAQNSDLFIIVGTSGEIMPASQIPIIAKQNDCKIIEINTDSSNYTNSITDIFLQGKATTVFELLDNEINALLTK